MAWNIGQQERLEELSTRERSARLTSDERAELRGLRRWRRVSATELEFEREGSSGELVVRRTDGERLLERAKLDRRRRLRQKRTHARSFA